ncbi:Phenoloxidase-activating factor 2 [Eumeta japonica]|uniref:Phenoloxidase-activating factor 2 n=1 Tax=Eumeta variegata TaxID=151549 RepID=A0A4C1V2R0_EUMVA|nr:Phenoloxidase-activating factor 2 [Eumeta japonica]
MTFKENAEGKPTVEKRQQQPERAGCGWRNPNGVGARPAGLTDGDANFAEFPWVVAIIRYSIPSQETGNALVTPLGLRVSVSGHYLLAGADVNEAGARPQEVYVGGGSLIHPSVVLTAAHNVAVTAGLRVRAGEWDTRTDSEPHPPQDRDVVDVKVHQDYISGTLFYDVALLFLASPVKLAPNVGTVCLPNPNDRPRPSTRCFAAGWGKDQFGDGNKLHTILKKVSFRFRRNGVYGRRQPRSSHRYESRYADLFGDSGVAARVSPGADLK